MKRIACMLVMAAISVVLVQPVSAEDTDPKDMPWDKAYLSLGYYFVTVDSGFRLGLDNLGAGIELDVEEFLGLDSTDAAFRVDAGYRYGKTRKHVVDFSWFGFRRDGSKTLTADVDLPPELGGGTITEGTTVNSVFNFDIYRLKYRYSLILDERVDLHLGLGLFIMPLEFGLAATGDPVTTTKITAPLPVIAVGVDVALSPKWFLRQNLELFYLEMGHYEGNITTTRLALEYYAWKHVALGLGIEGTRISVAATGETNVPGVDFNGSVSFNYFGAQAFLKFYY